MYFLLPIALVIFNQAVLVLFILYYFFRTVWAEPIFYYPSHNTIYQENRVGE